MKTKLLLILTFAMCGAVGCDSESYSDEQPSIPADSEISNPVYNGPRIVIIDSCEYIANGKQLTHKGNCKNKIHKR